jgi:hypothetical protein
MPEINEQVNTAVSPPTRREKRERSRRLTRLATPFFAVLFALTVVAFIIPLRPTESESEKRSLAAFPDFSVSALLSGSWFDDISSWFSDTFPGRETWLAAASRMNELHGISDVTIYGQLGQADAIPTVTERPAATPTPTGTPAPSPTPEATPQPTPEVVETSPPEQSVEHWGGLGDDGEAEVIFGNVLQIGDAAFAYYGFSQSGSDRHIALMNTFSEAMAEKGVRVFDVLIPTSVGVLVSSDYMEQIKCSDQGATIKYMFSNMNDTVQKVNIFNTLVEHNSEYLYFRTDHHWTALGAYYGYQQLCAVAGFEAAELDSFTPLEQGTFKGSYYYNCNQSSKLRLDDVLAYDPPGNLTMKITGTDGKTFPWPVLTDMSKSADNSKYMVFLGGDHPLTVITNDDLPDAPNCVVVKDSFGNPFAPFLTQNYHKVYVVDYRTYTAMKLRAFVESYEIDDVLFVESLAMAQGDGTLNLLESFCR